MSNDLIFIVLWVLVFVILWAIVVYNNIISAINSAEETKSTIDVMLKNRFDLLPNLVAVVKWYTKHEAETLEKIAALRTWNNDIELDWAIGSAIKNVFAVAEWYPDLKANENFHMLQLQIEAMEDKLQAARRTYNAAVKHLLDNTMMFPNNLMANTMTIPKFTMFEAEASEKGNPGIKNL